MENPRIFKPNRCILELTYNCNLKCRTCTIWERPKKWPGRENAPLSAEEIKLVQRSLKDAGINRITYLGGEPFLNPDILDISQNAKSEGLSTAVVTNGTAITQDKIKNIVTDELFDIIIFSIDGPEQIHDNIRGKNGTFKKAIETIKDIQKLKKSKKYSRPKIYFYCTVSSLNYNCLEEVFQLAQKLDAAALKFLSISCVTKNLIERTNSILKLPAIITHSYSVESSLRIPEKELSRISHTLNILNERAKIIGLKLIAEKFLMGEKSPKSCELLPRDFVISAFGDIYPCPMLPELTTGNIRNTPLKELLAKSESQIDYINNLSSARKLPVCGECCVEKLF